MRAHNVRDFEAKGLGRRSLVQSMSLTARNLSGMGLGTHRWCHGRLRSYGGDGIDTLRPHRRRIVLPVVIALA